MLLQQALGHHQANRFAEAATGYAEARKLEPTNFDAYHLGGVVALQRGEHRQAVTLLERALAMRPKSGASHMCLGLSQALLGGQAEAEKHLRTATQLEPQNFEAWSNLASCLVQCGKLPEAADAFRRCVKINAKSAQGWSGLGSVLQLMGQSREAIEHHSRALSIDPRHPKAWLSRAQSLLSLNRTAEALADFEKQISLFPRDLEAASLRLFLLNYDPALSREYVASEHRKIGLKLDQAQPRRTSFPNTREPAKRLRVAFLSPDLRDHSVAFFFEPLVRHLDPAGFEVFLYHDHVRTDDVSRRLQEQASTWRNFVGQADSSVEARILEDAPDILVEMAGHSGSNRLPMLARRVAPVQISYLGYPNTTGVPAIDYRFTDAFADPVSESDALATERLVRLPRCAWTYQPPHYAPQIRPRVRSENEPFTFGSFNNLAKLNPQTFALWANVLHAVPHSRLLIKGLLLEEKLVRTWTDQAGIDPDRVVTLPGTATAAEHLRCYERVDVALDPFPYSGTTTTCEALWMGVPVISLYGDRHSSRVGASLLNAVGHPEWIANSKEDYVQIAQRFAADLKKLDEIRSCLRAEMSASPLLDHAWQAEHFGQALRHCWMEHCGANVAPQTVAV